MPDSINNPWLDALIEATEKHAEEISAALGQKVEPFVFVVEEEKDAAIGFLKRPDAKQSFKILRSMGDDYETGIELCARAQLVRTADLESRGLTGSASDERFMDVDGKYLSENSELNLSLLMRVATLIRPFSDQFKKK